MAIKCLILLALLGASPLRAYVLLSGREGAILPVSVGAPTAIFYWDGNAPEITSRDEVKSDGSWDNLSNEEVMSQMILLAMDTWNNVPGSYVRLTLKQSSSATINSSDKLNSIVPESSSNLSEAGHAIPVISDKVINDCDISIGNGSTAAISLLHTLVHELGHCLGLGHEHKNIHAIMGYSSSTPGYSLGADDMAGLIYLYPNPTTSPSESGCGLLTGNNDVEQASTLFWFVLPLGILGLSRRRDRNA